MNIALQHTLKKHLCSLPLKNYIKHLAKYEYTTSTTQANTKTRPCKPVMVKQLAQFLQPKDDQIFIDMTFGSGGHSEAILNETKTSKIIALDRDPVGYEYACRLSQLYPDRVVPLLGRFSELSSLLKNLKFYQNSIDGILFDFGCSSMQLNNPSYGLSTSKNGPLDMRMDGDRFPDQPRASDVLAKASEEELARIFKVYGEEKQYKKIAQAIVQSRYMFRKLETTQELADLVTSVCEADFRVDKLGRPTHSATKVFQALRIFVNNELNEINYAMILAQRYLKIGGRMVTISYNSLEDTIVKRHIIGNLINDVANRLPLKYASHGMVHDKEIVDVFLETCWEPLNRHVITPTLEEVDENPLSKSARIRAAIKLK